MATLSDRYTYTMVGTKGVLVDSASGAEHLIELANTPEAPNLGSLLTSIREAIETHGNNPAYDLIPGFPLTNQELVGLLFWSGYFYRSAV